MSREDAEEELGQISEETWQRMVEAFDAHRAVQHLHDASPVAADLGKRHAKATRDLEKAKTAVMTIMHDQELLRAVMSEATRNPADGFDPDLIKHLAAAAKSLSRAAAVLKVGRPQKTKGISDAELRRRLVWRLRSICDEAGLPIKLTTGFENDRPDNETSFDDLSPFERFIIAARVHIADRPESTAKWIREACQGWEETARGR